MKMFHGIAALVASAVVWIVSAPLRAEPPVTALLKLHTEEAAAYRIFQDEGQRQLLALSETPIFNWTNIVGAQAQYGHLFLWIKDGRPEVIGTIFSTPASDPGKRMLVHEFHTLSLRRLFPVTPARSAYQWTPEKGIVLTADVRDPAVADAATVRLRQMRTLARSFAGETRNHEGRTLELRLLTTPLWRYERPSGEIHDGALFAMVSSEGTDPEIVLVIEARPAPGAAEGLAWHTAALRFSDKEITVKRNGTLLWSSLTDESRRVKINGDYTLIQTPDKTYTCYRSRIIDELPDAEK